MNPDQHDLAEWVARWAGWLFNDEKGVMMSRSIHSFLTDPSLAWRAEDELIARLGHEKAAAAVAAIMREHCCSRIEAMHRANRLRAEREG